MFNASGVRERWLCVGGSSPIGRPLPPQAPPSPPSPDLYYALVYNAGVQTLHTGQPQAAFDLLLEVVQVCPANPRLWLRLAECCIMCHKQVGPSFPARGVGIAI